VCVCGLLVVFLKHRLHLSDYATFPFDFHKLFTAHRLCKEMGSWKCVCMCVCIPSGSFTCCILYVRIAGWRDHSKNRPTVSSITFYFFFFSCFCPKVKKDKLMLNRKIIHFACAVNFYLFFIFYARYSYHKENMVLEDHYWGINFAHSQLVHFITFYYWSYWEYLCVCVCVCTY